jgi:hypothetical protein
MNVAFRRNVPREAITSATYREPLTDYTLRGALQRVG